MVSLPPPEPFSTISSYELCQKEFPAQQWLIERLLPEGVTLLVGRPKIAKSWMALQIGILASRGHFHFLGEPVADPVEVLYFALEDSDRRIRNRVERMQEGEGDSMLFFSTQLRRINEGGLREIDEWLDGHPKCKLVVIDTLARIRPINLKAGNIYLEDTSIGASLQGLAVKHRIAVLVVHHTNKGINLDDPLDAVSGTQGLAGSVDAIWMLARRRNKSEGKLFITGRDIEEQTLRVYFDSQTGLWHLLGRIDDSEE